MAGDGLNRPKKHRRLNFNVILSLSKKIKKEEKMEENKKDEIESLLPQKMVAGHEIYPWSWKKIKDLYPTIQECIGIFKDAGIGLHNIESEIIKKPEVLIKVAFDHGAKIIAVTLGIGIEEAEELDAGKVIELLFAIIFQNLNFIKNSLSLVEKAKTELVYTRP